MGYNFWAILSSRACPYMESMAVNTINRSTEVNGEIAFSFSLRLSSATLGKNVLALLTVRALQAHSPFP